MKFLSMHYKNLILSTLFFFFAGTTFMTAQTSLTTNAHGFMPSETSLEEITEENWSFFTDDESKVAYIDFETIKMNLSEIVVKNNEGEVLVKEDVFDLPVNTIFEIDFSTYRQGDYDVELRSFTGMIKKSFSVQ